MNSIPPTDLPHADPGDEASQASAEQHLPAQDPPRGWQHADLSRPRLADLFVLTFNLSVFLAFCRYAYGSDVNFVLYTLTEFELFGYGIGVACCWTGVYRMLRPARGLVGLPFRLWQPGEVICLVEGSYYLIVALMSAGFRQWLLGGAAESPEDSELDISVSTLALAYAAPPLVLCLGYVWLARRVTLRAWRRGAIAKVIAHAATPLLLWMLVSDLPFDFQSSISALLLASIVIPAAMILLAAWSDRKLQNVHWLHWLGVFAFAVIYLSRLSVEARAFAELLEG